MKYFKTSLTLLVLISLVKFIEFLPTERIERKLRSNNLQEKIQKNNKIKDELSNIYIYNVTSGELKYSLEGHSDIVYALLKLDNNLLASGSDDYTICIWNLTTGDLNRTLIGHEEGIFSLVSLGKNLLASGDRDGMVFIWNLTTGDALFKLESLGYVHSLLKLDETLLAVGLPGGVMIWNFTSGELIATLQNGDGDTSSLVKVGQDIMVSEPDDGTVSIWNLTSYTLKFSFSVDPGIWATSLAVLDDQRIAVGNSFDCDKNTSCILIYNVHTGKTEGVYTLPTPDMIIALAMVNSSSLACLSFGENESGNDISNLNVWNATSGKLVWTSEPVANMSVQLTVFSNNILATGSVGDGPGAVNIYDLSEEKTKMVKTPVSMTKVVSLDKNLLASTFGF